MNSQTAFAHALQDLELPCPSGLTTWNGSDPSTRFAVYRNNVMVSLIDGLADTYPVVQELVGEEFFRAMAKVFVQSNPPSSRIMAHYGQGFADFLESFPPAASVPYLADVTRLEMARVQAYHSADVSSIEPSVVHAALAVPELLHSLRLRLHPSVCVIQSEFAVFSLWAAHQGALSITSVNPEQTQSALVFRSGLDVSTLEIAAGAGLFVSALGAGETLLDASETATSTDSKFDLIHALTMLLRLQLITHITTGDGQHELAH